MLYTTASEQACHGSCNDLWIRCQEEEKLVTSVAASGPHVRSSSGSKSFIRKLRMEPQASLHQVRHLSGLSRRAGLLKAHTIHKAVTLMHRHAPSVQEHSCVRAACKMR